MAKNGDSRKGRGGTRGGMSDEDRALFDAFRIAAAGKSGKWVQGETDGQLRGDTVDKWLKLPPGEYPARLISKNKIAMQAYVARYRHEPQSGRPPASDKQKAAAFDALWGVFQIFTSPGAGESPEETADRIGQMLRRVAAAQPAIPPDTRAGEDTG